MYSSCSGNARAASTEEQHQYTTVLGKGVFLSPAHIGCCRCNVQNEEKCTKLYMPIHEPSFVRSHVKCLFQSALWHTLFEEQLHLFHILLVQGLHPRKNNGFYSELDMNQTFRTKQCALTQHSQGME
jgi:hypothetical protein